MPKFIDMTGEKFNSLTVLSRSGTQGRGQAAWLCRCDCGSDVVVRGDQIRSGRTKSCGCLQQIAAKNANTKHGMARERGKTTKVYSTWRHMKARCTLKTHVAFAYYGGRGIKVCERWMSFENFLADMGLPPTADHTIDRIDPDGDYCPENCRWATWEEQGATKRTTRLVSINGVEKPLAVWIREFGIGHATVYKRISKGMDIVQAITTPPDARFRATRHQRPL